MHRAGFAFDGDIQYRFCRQRQRIAIFRSSPAAGSLFFQTRNDEIQLFGAAGVRDKQHHVTTIKHPGSPCSASAGWTKGRSAGTGESGRQFLPIWPDLPIPETTSFPSQWMMVSAARMKSSPGVQAGGWPPVAPASGSGVRLLTESYSCSSPVIITSMPFFSSARWNVGVNTGIGNQLIHALEAADDVRALTAKL